MTAGFSAEERILLRGEEQAALRSLRGWYPLLARREELFWRFFGNKPFTEPFFHDTVTALAERCWTRTSFAALEEFDDALAPSAFIFHVSRCGSTLLTQLLSAIPGCVAISEPTAIDSFLRLYHAGTGPSEAETALRQLVAALGQKRFPGERHFFIKLDSWHIGSLPLFRRTFPQTPFLFLYRQPYEVLASHRRRRGRQMVPGVVDMSPLQPDTADIAAGDLDGYCARVLECFYDAACRHGQELTLIDYRQLPEVVWTGIPEKFSIDMTSNVLASLRARSKLHSKRMDSYEGDPPHLEVLGNGKAGATLLRHYEALERLRHAQASFGAKS